MSTEFFRKEVATHNSSDSLWIIYDNKVYDISTFAESHPGGIEWLAKFGGQDVTFVMADDDLHIHSKQAYDILFDNQIGVIKKADLWIEKNASSTSSDKKTGKIGSESEQAPSIIGTASKQFLDPNKPLFSQMINSNYTKEFYIEQVHIPRHIAGNAIFFENPILEKFTVTPWYVVPAFWLPVIFYFANLGLKQVPIEVFYKYLIIGILTWPLFEYTMHRFLFHFDKNIPEGTLSQVLHFTLHGFHHFLPMDSMRLVMPPVLSSAIATSLYFPLSYIIPQGIIQGFFCGMALMYIVYDETHYWLHHGYFKYDFIKRLKSHHLEHHYRIYNKGFGITTDFWDRFFKTTFAESTTK